MRREAWLWVLCLGAGCRAPLDGSLFEPLPDGGPGLEVDAGRLPDGGVPQGRVEEAEVEGRRFRLFVPAQAARGPLPLLVMLHGCAQTPEDFARGTGMDELGAREGFAVLYPEQPASANSSRCWNWALPEHQGRDFGEPRLLAAMVAEAKRRVEVDERRVFAAGISAGAAMAVVLAATYPELFSAIGVHSGLEYRAAQSLTQGLWAMSAGGPSPAVQGTLAYHAMGARARPMPVLVLHGSLDTTVRPVNATQLVSQWAQTNDWATDGRDDDNVDDAAEHTGVQVTNGRRFTRATYAERRTQQVLVELVLVDGLGHAWSGGNPAGSYTDPAGPSASALAWAFFLAHPR